jgi:hypothetical protein
MGPIQEVGGLLSALRLSGGIDREEIRFQTAECRFKSGIVAEANELVAIFVASLKTAKK